VVPQSQIPKQAVIFQDFIAQVLDLWFVLEMEVPFQEPLIQLNYLTQRQMLSGGVVQAASRLDKLGMYESAGSSGT